MVPAQPQCTRYDPLVIPPASADRASNGSEEQKDQANYEKDAAHRIQDRNSGEPADNEQDDPENNHFSSKDLDALTAPCGVPGPPRSAAVGGSFPGTAPPKPVLTTHLCNDRRRRELKFLLVDLGQLMGEPPVTPTTSEVI
jgi:hypothetical protein